MASKCCVCKEPLNRDPIMCFGICGRQYHARCAGMTSTQIKSLNESERLKFICDGCEKTSHNVIMQKVITMMEDMCRIRQISDDVNDIKQIVNKSEDDLKSIYDNIDEVKNSINGNRNANNVEKINANKSTYAEKVKQNEPVVLIVPKNKQTSTETKNVIMQSLNPTDIPISKLRTAANGTVVIEGKSKRSAEEIQKYASSRLSESYDVKVTELKKPKIRVVGMYEKPTVEELVNQIKNQNDLGDKGELKVLSVYGKQKFGAILEVESNAFDYIMNTCNKTLNIGWAKCSVFEYLNIRRCFKCYGFNHIAKDCTRKKACLRCAGEHEFNLCKAKSEKCVNCIHANKKFKLKLDTKHAANAKECKVLQREEKLKRSRIQYNILCDSNK